MSALGAAGKIEALVPGPTRFWPEHLGPAPVPKLISSPRQPKAPVSLDIPVDETLLQAGDHNGSTFYQHQGFLEVLRGTRDVPDVSLFDGWIAVRMGQAAQLSAETGRAIDMKAFLNDQT